MKDKTENINFYDIESLGNVFTLCNYKNRENHVDIYYLCDDPHILTDSGSSNLYKKILTRIYEKNQNFNGAITLYDLKYDESNKHLAKTFGLSDAYNANNPYNQNSYPNEFRLVCDTDKDYDTDKHPYLMGYNSYNYDTTMLAMYLHETFEQQNTNTTKPVKASLMREYNDELFLPMFKNSMPSRLTQTFDQTTKTWSYPNYKDARWKIRKNMLMSGRHLDVAKLNQAQRFVGLKRLLGLLGHQILESDKLGIGSNTIENQEQFLDLIAYNVSDCVNLEHLFNHRAYISQFKIKLDLLKAYPELVYEQMKNGEYKPNIDPTMVRRDRLTIDATSAQLATKSLAPYGPLTDIPAVSFNYPSAKVAKELGIKQTNVLEDAKEFFYKNFHQADVRAQFDKIYNYYKLIEGKNFNDSETYEKDYGGTNLYQEPQTLAKIPKDDNCMPYFNKDGSPTECFVTFSTGGIHGAEYNKARYEFDLEQYNKLEETYAYVKGLYPDPLDLKKARHIEIDGVKTPATKFLKAGSTLKKSEYKDISKQKPILFQLKKDNSTKLNAKYVYTSADYANHEDFTSYYPNLLRMLSAFYNAGLGYDRYAEIFDNKEKYGVLRKDETLTQAERDAYDDLREGTKLILNAASGAADSSFESNIRVNNVVISMRIIGQLFSWRIGQAQAIHGAKMPSTNTDGLYSVLEKELNNKILAEESAGIGVEIEPEPLYLISKDSNNRIELDETTGKIFSASGGTLACRQGPDPTKALSHPAIIDWALCEYLIFVSFPNKRDATLNNPFDDEAGMNILKSAKEEFDTRTYLLMFQNIVASSPSSNTYMFGTTDGDLTNPIILQHYNRVFIMQDKTPNTVHLHSAHSKKLTPATIRKRQRDKTKPQEHDFTAIKVLKSHGFDFDNIPDDREAAIKKVTNIEEDWYMYIQNKALEDLTDEEVEFIIDNLDLDKYLSLLRDCFERNWRNIIPELD